MEGLDQVIVGALLEAFDLVLPARTRGQDQHRELLAFVAQGLDQLHARHLGQAEVDDADVERHLAAHVQAFLAILGGIDRKAFALQAGGQGLAQRGFVFDEQNTHGSLREAGQADGSAASRPIGCPIQSSFAACRRTQRCVRCWTATAAGIVHVDANPAAGHRRS